jgi:hypothetical protein
MQGYKSKKFKDLGNICQNSKILSSIQNTCEYLDELNQILIKCIPPQYINLCHFGAVDIDRNIAILFVKEQQVFHILRTMSEHILRTLSKHNFSFNGILYQLKKYRKHHVPSISYKNLSEKEKDQLRKFAALIGKPELVIEQTETTDDDDLEVIL